MIYGVAGRVILFTAAGFVAGLLTWFVSDLSGFVRIGNNVGVLTPREQTAYWIVFMCWGGLIGLLLSIADALASGARPVWWSLLLVGAGVGILSGVIGGALGMGIFSVFYRFPARTPLDFLGNVVGRAAGWAFIGALAGTAPGWRKLSLRVGRNGLIGGLIGGILGGSAFEIIPYLLVGMPELGGLARLFGFVITGSTIGLFIALVQELLKEAWVKVVVGRNEGREILIDRAEMRIGRHELSDIPLFGDSQVARTHALLLAQPGGRFVLRDTGESPLGVCVNDQRIAGEQVIKSGDRIQIAGRTLLFFERFTSRPTVPEKRDVARSRPAATPGISPLSDLPPPHFPAPPSNAQRLVAVAGPYAGKTFNIRPGVTIGRDPGADIALTDDARASRIHARLVADPAGIAIEDAGSTNGTYVNGQKVSRQILVAGDTVQIGTTFLRLE